jgi:hypothetical protein
VSITKVILFSPQIQKKLFCNFLNFLRISTHFTSFCKRSNTISEQTFKQAPRIFQRVTDIPLLRRWTPGKFWGLAIGCSGADRRRSGQNPASRRPCPAGRGRGKGPAGPRGSIPVLGWGKERAGEGAHQRPASAAAATAVPARLHLRRGKRQFGRLGWRSTVVIMRSIWSGVA